MSTDEDHQKGYRWISPIMQFGNKVEVEALAQRGENADKSAVAISALRGALNEDERVIYFCETFSAQCNMSGLNNFFKDSIGLFYYEVVWALERLGSVEMAQTLKRCKELIFGDQDVPVGDESRFYEFISPDRPDWDEIEGELDQIDEDSGEERELFEDRLLQFAIASGESGKLTKLGG